MKHFRIVFMLVSILLFFSFIAYSEENVSKSDIDVYSVDQPVQEEKVCMSPEVAKKLAVEIQQCRIVNKNIINYYKSNIELTNQINLLKEEIELEKQKYDLTKASLENIEKIYEKKMELLNKDLEEAKKPRWGAMAASAGGGSILTLVVIALITL